MPRNSKQTKESSGVDVQPTSLTELEPIVIEFMNKYQSITNEEETLKIDKKELVEEYSEKLDMKTLQLALKTLKLQSKVERKDTFDSFMEILVRSSENP